ncbi:hypothetical protein D3C75_1029740 [compost metagenome]
MRVGKNRRHVILNEYPGFQRSKGRCDQADFHSAIFNPLFDLKRSSFYQFNRHLRIFLVKSVDHIGQQINGCRRKRAYLQRSTQQIVFHTRDLHHFIFQRNHLLAKQQQFLTDRC